TAFRYHTPSAARRANDGKCSASRLPSPSISEVRGNSSNTTMTTGYGSPTLTDSGTSGRAANTTSAAGVATRNQPATMDGASPKKSRPVRTTGTSAYSPASTAPATAAAAPNTGAGHPAPPDATKTDAVATAIRTAR